MTVQHILGALLLVSLFGALAAASVRLVGWRDALLVWAGTFVITSIVMAASFLLTGGL